MQIAIDIPEEFENHFKEDDFEDSLHRLGTDAHLTASMLIESLKNGTILPKGHGRLIDADATLKRHCNELCKHKPSCEENCIIYDLLHLATTILEEDKGDEAMKKDKEFIEIITSGKKDKSYYEIKYLDLQDNQIHIGYSSYSLGIISKYLKEFFM